MHSRVRRISRASPSGSEVVLVPILCAILSFDAVALADPPAPPVEETRADPKAEALAHFEKGNALFKSDALAAALAEFLESRKLYPTKSATSNAALCLTRLQRFDEALDLYESLLKEFPDLPEDLKARAQREVVRLRELTGTIEIAGAALGTAITIDGRSRGEFPASGLLRVVAGSHIVRVTKQGFEPFEIRVEVAGGKIVHVPARLRALAASGRLHIVEQSGKVLSAVVDGAVVGKTPFDGLLEVGDHAVFLRGEGELGTPPVAVHVEQNQVTPLTLAVQDLSAEIRIEPVPANANLAIDGVTVGRGIWEGRLPAGAHKVEVTAPGFLPEVRQVTLARSERPILAIVLKRDLSSPRSSTSPEQERRVPISAVDRPLVDPQGTLAQGGAVFLGRQGSLLALPPRRDDTYAGLSVSAWYSITDDLEIGSQMVAVYFTPALKGFLPDLGLTQRVVRGDFELGLHADVQPNLKDYDPYGVLQRSEGVDLGMTLPMRYHIAHAVKLYFSPSVGFSIPFASRTLNDTTLVSVSLPLSAYVRVVEPFSLGLWSGCSILRVDKAKETAVIRAGASALITIPGRRGPILDIHPSFSFPYLFAPASPLQKVNTDLWQVALSFTGYVDL